MAFSLDPPERDRVAEKVGWRLSITVEGGVSDTVNWECWGWGGWESGFNATDSHCCKQVLLVFLEEILDLLYALGIISRAYVLSLTHEHHQYVFVVGDWGSLLAHHSVGLLLF